MTPEEHEMQRLERHAEHLRERHDRMADLLSTMNTRLCMTDSWSWHTSTGARLRITNVGITGGYGVELDGEFVGFYDTQDQAFAAAVEAAPPADEIAARALSRPVYETTKEEP